MSVASGFVGSRLLEARRARRIMASDLADMANVSVQSISKYENEHQTPRHEVVERFASVLGMPWEYFFRQKAESDPKPVFWRSKLSAQTSSLDRALVRLDWLKETVDYLGEFFDFPELNLPYVTVPNSIYDLRFEDIEEIAKIVRDFWGVNRGPLPDVIDYIESTGILVSRIHVDAEKVDAFSQWSDRHSIPFIMLSRDKASAVRQRFDALHELGHIILHKNITQKELNHRETYKLLEEQAHFFAGCMLMPERDFVHELYAPTLDAMLSMKERWGTSVAAMIMRCKNLDLLNDDGAKRLWINYSRRGWRKGEPFDGKMDKEQPFLIRRSFELLISEGVQSVPDIRNSLPFPVEDLEEMTDVDKGTFGGSKGSRAEPKFKSTPSEGKKTWLTLRDLRRGENIFG